MVNEVWVYGDTILTGWYNNFTGNGTGSVFTLDYKPHNTEVTVSGVSKNGAVFEMVNIPVSGQHYLVNYNDLKIIFTSGTSAGYNVPGSLSPVVIKYDRSSPIIKYGKNNASISAYGRKDKVIVDKNITDPRSATDIVQNQLSLYSEPLRDGNLVLDQILVVTPGQTCIVNLPYQNINSEIFTILEARYNFTAESVLSENTLTIKVNEKIKDVTDTLKQIILDLKKLQVADIDASDVITRLETGTGSFGFKVDTWQVYTWDIGSKFILNHPINGRLGAVTGTQPYLAGSFGKSWSIQISGGE